MGISQYDQMNYAQFTPLSIQEIWAPGQELRMQHDILQEEYAQQEQQGSLSLQGIDPVKDRVAHEIQQNFMNETKKAADELATKGFIDSGRRRGLSKLKSMYAMQVVPYKNALLKRQEAQKLEQEIILKDQTYRFKNKASERSLDEYIKDPNAFNVSGISVGTMAADAAREYSQISKMVAQKYPSIAQTGITGKLWTVVNSGATMEEISGFIANEARNANADPKVMSALGQEMHNVVENNLQKHGAYKTFGDDPKAMNELRSSVANMAIYALNDPKFGQMDDPWAIARAEAEAVERANDDELLPEEIYSPSLNKEAISNLDKLGEAVITGPKLGYVEDKDAKGIVDLLNKKSGKKMTIKEWRESTGNISKVDALNKLRELGARNGAGDIKISSTGNVAVADLAAYTKKAIEAEKEYYKKVNKSYSISTVDQDVAGGIVNQLLQKPENDGGLSDQDGNSFDYDSGSLAGISTDFDFKNGLALNIPGKDGKIHTVKYDVEDLKIKAISDDYNLIKRVDSGDINISDLKITKEQYDAFKLKTLKSIRRRLSLKGEATGVKPKLK